MHSFVALLTLVFAGVHVAAVWVDPFTRFGWRDVFIPLASSYRPLWLALGIVGLYLLLAVWVSTQVRARIGYAWWRRLHTLAFVVYLLTTVHGLGTGTDTRQAWALGFYAGSVALVGALLTKRLLTPAGARGRAYPRLAALTVVVVLGGVAWAATGPAHAGWSAIASHIL